MEFFVLRTVEWRRPSHNLESQEVLPVETICAKNSFFTIKFLNQTWHCKVQIDIVCSEIANVHCQTVVGKRIHKELRKFLKDKFGNMKDMDDYW